MAKKKPPKQPVPARKSPSPPPLKVYVPPIEDPVPEFDPATVLDLPSVSLGNTDCEVPLSPSLSTELDIHPTLVSDAEPPFSETLATVSCDVPVVKEGSTVLAVQASAEKVAIVSSSVPEQSNSPVTSSAPDLTKAPSSSVEQAKSPAEIWKGFVKPTQIKLQPKETPFLLESGESCVTIPNSVVEKNKKAWEYFIIGQFYEEAPARGAVHAIANVIWRNQRRDISVSKMEGNSFLFRVPCPNARRRILRQNFWQIDGQTMFVAKWAPGLQQVKPELEMVPVWLEFTGVPLQFFNSEALQEIACIVGHPVCLHPSTENLTNIEVAKVYTVIDPRKPLPAFVNARFQNGDTRRIAVTSPWLPSQCTFCNKLGHTISRCKAAPRTCAACNSVRHTTENIPRGLNLPPKDKGKAPIKNLLPIVSRNKRESSPKQVYKEIQKKTNVPSHSVLVRDSVANAAAVFKEAETNEGPSLVSNYGVTVATVHDLNKGQLYVDLSGSPGHSLIASSSSGESSAELDSISGDEDNPGDSQDEFIEVISKRSKKQLKDKEKSRARVRGPQIL